MIPALWNACAGCARVHKRAPVKVISRIENEHCVGQHSSGQRMRLSPCLDDSKLCLIERPDMRVLPAPLASACKGGGPALDPVQETELVAAS
jgi:hypothetical protein